MANRPNRPPSLDIATSHLTGPSTHHKRAAGDEEEDEDKTPEYPLHHDHPLAQLNRRRLEEALISGKEHPRHLPSHTPNRCLPPPLPFQISNNEGIEVSNSSHRKRDDSVYQAFSLPVHGGSSWDRAISLKMNVTSVERIPALTPTSSIDSPTPSLDTKSCCPSDSMVSDSGDLAPKQSLPAGGIPDAGSKQCCVDVTSAGQSSIAARSHALVLKSDEGSTSSETELSGVHKDSNNNADQKTAVRTTPVTDISMSDPNEELPLNLSRDKEDDMPLNIGIEQDDGFDDHGDVENKEDDDDDILCKSPPHLVPMDEDFSCNDSLLGSPDQPLPPKLSPVSSHCCVMGNLHTESLSDKASMLCSQSTRSLPKNASHQANHSTVSPPEITSNLGGQSTESPPNKASNQSDFHKKSPLEKVSHQGNFHTESPREKTHNQGSRSIEASPDKASHQGKLHTESPPNKASNQGDFHKKSPLEKVSHQGNFHTESPREKTHNQGSRSIEASPDKASHQGNLHNESPPNKASKQGNLHTESPPDKASHQGNPHTESPPDKASHQGNLHTESPPDKASHQGNLHTKSPPDKASHQGNLHTKSPPEKASHQGNLHTESPSEKASHLVLGASPEREKQQQCALQLNSPRSNVKTFQTTDFVEDDSCESSPSDKARRKILKPLPPSLLLKAKDKRHRENEKRRRRFKRRYNKTARVLPGRSQVSACNGSNPDLVSKYLVLNGKRKSKPHQSNTKFKKKRKSDFVSETRDNSPRLKPHFTSSTDTFLGKSVSACDNLVKDSLGNDKFPQFSPLVANFSSSEENVPTCSSGNFHKTEFQTISCSTYQEKVDVNSQNNVLTETKMEHIPPSDRFLCPNISATKTANSINVTRSVNTPQPCATPDFKCTTSSVPLVICTDNSLSSPIINKDTAPLLSTPLHPSGRLITNTSSPSHLPHSTTTCSPEIPPYTCTLNATTSIQGSETTVLEVSPQDMIDNPVSETIVQTSKSTAPITEAVSISHTYHSEGHTNALAINSHQEYLKEQCVTDSTPCITQVCPIQACKSFSEYTAHTIQNMNIMSIDFNSKNISSNVVFSAKDRAKTQADNVTKTDHLSLPSCMDGLSHSSPVACLNTSVSVVGHQMPIRCYPYTLSQAVGKSTNCTAPHNTIIGNTNITRDTGEPARYNVIPTIHITTFGSIYRPGHNQSVQNPYTTPATVPFIYPLHQKDTLDGRGLSEKGHLTHNTQLKPLSEAVSSSLSSSSSLSVRTQAKTSPLSKSTSNPITQVSKALPRSSVQSLDLSPFLLREAGSLAHTTASDAFPNQSLPSSTRSEQGNREHSVRKHLEVAGSSQLGQNSSPYGHHISPGPPNSSSSNFLSPVVTFNLDSRPSFSNQNSPLLTHGKTETLRSEQNLLLQQKHSSPSTQQQNLKTSQEQNQPSTLIQNILWTHQSNSVLHVTHPTSLSTKVTPVSPGSTLSTEPGVFSPPSTDEGLSLEKKDLVVEDDDDNQELLVLPTRESVRGTRNPLRIDMGQSSITFSQSNLETDEGLSPSEDQDLASFMSSCASVPLPRSYQSDQAQGRKSGGSWTEDADLLDEERDLVVHGLDIDSPLTVSLSVKDKEQVVVKCESPTFINEKSSVFTVEDTVIEHEDDVIDDDDLREVSSSTSSPVTHSPSNGLPLKDFFTLNPAGKSYSSLAVEAINNKTRKLKEVECHSRKDSDSEDIRKFLMGEDMEVQENTSNRNKKTTRKVFQSREFIDLTLENTKPVISISSDEGETDEEVENDCEAMVSDYMVSPDPTVIGNHNNQDIEDVTVDSNIMSVDSYNDVLSANAASHPLNISTSLAQRIRSYALKISSAKKAELSARINSIIVKKSELLPEALRPSILFPDHKRLSPQQPVSATPEQDIRDQVISLDNSKPASQAVYVSPLLPQTSATGIPDCEVKNQVVTLDNPMPIGVSSCTNTLLPQQTVLAIPDMDVINPVMPCTNAGATDETESLDRLRVPPQCTVQGNSSLTTETAQMEVMVSNPSTNKEIAELATWTRRNSETARTLQVAGNTNPSNVLPLDTALNPEPVYYRTVWQSHFDDNNTSSQSDITVQSQSISKQTAIMQSTASCKDDGLFQKLKLLKLAGKITSTSTVRDHKNGDPATSGAGDDTLAPLDVRSDGVIGPLNLSKTKPSEDEKAGSPVKKETDYQNYVQKKLLATQSRSNSVEDKDTATVATCNYLTTTSTRIQHVVSPFCIRLQDSSDLEDKQKTRSYPSSPMHRKSPEVKGQAEDDLKAQANKQRDAVNAINCRQNGVLEGDRRITESQHRKAHALAANLAYIPPWQPQNISLEHPSSSAFLRPQIPNSISDNRPPKPNTEALQIHPNMVFVRPQPSHAHESRIPMDEDHVLVALETEKKTVSATSGRRSTGTDLMQGPLYKHGNKEQVQNKISSEPIILDSAGSRSHNISDLRWSQHSPTSETSTKSKGLDQWPEAFPTYIPIMRAGGTEATQQVLPCSGQPSHQNPIPSLTHRQRAPYGGTRLPLASPKAHPHPPRALPMPKAPPPYSLVQTHYVASSNDVSKSHAPPVYHATPSCTLPQSRVPPGLHAPPPMAYVPQLQTSSSHVAQFRAPPEYSRFHVPQTHASLPHDPQPHSSQPHSSQSHVILPHIPQSLAAWPHVSRPHVPQSHSSHSHATPQLHTPLFHNSQPYAPLFHTSKPHAHRSHAPHSNSFKPTAPHSQAPFLHDPSSPASLASHYNPSLLHNHQPIAPPSHAPQSYSPQSHAPKSHAPQYHGPQLQAPQSHGPQSHGPQSNGPQPQAPKYHGPQPQAHQSHGPQPQAPQSHGPQSHGPQPQAPQSHGPQSHGRQPQAPQSHAPQFHGPQPQAPKSHGPQPLAPQPYAPQFHGPQPQAPQSHGHQPQAPKSHGPQPQAPQSHGPQPQAPQSHGSQLQAPQPHGPQLQAPQSHSPHPQAPQSHGPQSHAPLPIVPQSLITIQSQVSQFHASTPHYTPGSHTVCHGSPAPSVPPSHSFSRAPRGQIQGSHVPPTHALYSYRFPSTQSHIRAQSYAFPQSQTPPLSDTSNQYYTIPQSHTTPQSHFLKQSHAPPPSQVSPQSHPIHKSHDTLPSHSSPQSNATPQSHTLPQFHAPFGSHAFPQFQVIPQSHTNTIPQPCGPMQSHIPPPSHFSPQSHGSPQSQTIPQSQAPLQSHVPPPSQFSPQSRGSPQSQTIPQSHVPPLCNTSPQSHKIPSRFPTPPAFAHPLVPSSQSLSFPPHAVPPPAHSRGLKSHSHPSLPAHNNASFPKSQSYSHPCSSSLEQSQTLFTTPLQSHVPGNHDHSLHYSQSHFHAPSSPPHVLVCDLSRKTPYRLDVYPLPPPAHSHNKRPHPSNSHTPPPDGMYQNSAQSNTYPLPTSIHGPPLPPNLYAASTLDHLTPQQPAYNQRDATRSSAIDPVQFPPSVVTQKSIHHIQHLHSLAPAPAKKPTRRRPRVKKGRRSSKIGQVNGQGEGNFDNVKDSVHIPEPDKDENVEVRNSRVPKSTAESETLQNVDPQVNGVLDSGDGAHSNVVTCLKNKLKNGHESNYAVPGVDDNMTKTRRTRKRKSNWKEKEAAPKRARRRKVSLKGNLPDVATSKKSPLFPSPVTITVSVSNENAKDNISNKDDSLYITCGKSSSSSDSINTTTTTTSINGISNNNSSIVINRPNSMETSLDPVESRSDSGFSDSGTLVDHPIEEPVNQQFVVKDYEENGIRLVSLQPITGTGAVIGKDLLEAVMTHENIRPDSDEMQLDCQASSMLEDSQVLSLQDDSGVKSNSSSQRAHYGGLSSLILASEKLEMASHVSTSAPMTDAEKLELLRTDSTLSPYYGIPSSESVSSVDAHEKVGITNNTTDPLSFRCDLEQNKTGQPIVTMLDTSQVRIPESIPDLIQVPSLAGCRSITEEEKQVASLLVSMVQTHVFNG